MLKGRLQERRPPVQAKVRREAIGTVVLTVWAPLVVADHQRDRTSLASVHPLKFASQFNAADARHEKVLAAAKHVERFDAVDAASDRLLRNGERRAFLLPPDDRVTLVADTDEIAVVDPLLLQEFDAWPSPWR